MERIEHFNANGYHRSIYSQEVAAYQWNIEQARMWNLSTKGFEAQAKLSTINLV